MLEASPKGTVPVLVLEDGTVIDESLDVMNWALEHRRSTAAGKRLTSMPPDALIERKLMARSRRRSTATNIQTAMKTKEVDKLEQRAIGAETFLAKLESTHSRRWRATATQPDQINPSRHTPSSLSCANSRIRTALWFDAEPLPHLQRWLAGHSRV